MKPLKAARDALNGWDPTGGAAIQPGKDHQPVDLFKAGGEGDRKALLLHQVNHKKGSERIWTGGASAFVLLALVAVAVWGYDQYRQKNDYNVFFAEPVSQDVLQAIDHVETIEADLAKAMVADSPQQNLVLYSDVEQAFSAQEKPLSPYPT